MSWHDNNKCAAAWPFNRLRARFIKRFFQKGNMNISELIGKQVLDKNGNNVGKVADFGIDLTHWTVNQIILRIGMIKKVPVGLDIIDKIGDKIILKITKDEL